MMNETPDGGVPTGLADLPLVEREHRAAAKQREIQEGFDRRHLSNAEYRQRYEAMQFDRILRIGDRRGG